MRKTRIASVINKTKANGISGFFRSFWMKESGRIAGLLTEVVDRIAVACPGIEVGSKVPAHRIFSQSLEVGFSFIGHT